MHAIMQYIYDHPEAVAIIWPILTGILSLAFGALGKRFPVIVAVLRASGLDLPALGAAVRKRLAPPPPPPPTQSATETPVTTSREVGQ